MINKIRKWIEKELSIENQIYNKLNHFENKLTIQFNKNNFVYNRAYISVSNKDITYVDLMAGVVTEYRNLSPISLFLKELNEEKLNNCIVFDEYGIINGE